MNHTTIALVHLKGGGMTIVKKDNFDFTDYVLLRVRASEVVDSNRVETGEKSKMDEYCHKDDTHLHKAKGQ